MSPNPLNNAGSNFYPLTIQTTGTTAINLGQLQSVSPPVVEPEPGPLDWLRSQVDEIRELAVAA